MEYIIFCVSSPALASKSQHAQEPVFLEKPRIRIMVADDHPVVCFGLLGIIRTQPDMEVVAEARNGREAVRLYREHRPDVIG